MKIEKKGNVYYHKGVKVTDAGILEYCRKLVIPPAYTDVVIYYNATRKYKLSFTGVDSKGRTQYIYQKWWSDKARNEKHCNILEYGRNIKNIEAHIKSVLNKGQIHAEYTQCLVVRIMMLGNFRIGNDKYKTLYDSHGIGTIECKHVQFDRKKKTVKIEFVGKKGVSNAATIDDPIIFSHLERLVKGKKPGSRVFETDTQIHASVNKFLLQFGDITSKMIRIWNANILLIDKIRTSDVGSSQTDRKKFINSAIKEIAETIHNTPTICKKEYINGDLIELFIEHPIKSKKIFTGTSSDAILLKYLSNDCSATGNSTS